MKPTKIVCYASFLLMRSMVVHAQGTLYVSNLGQTPIGSASVASDAWIAQVFFTGSNPNGYYLNSIQLLMNAASGNPSGFSVSIYSDPFQTSPLANIGSLVGSNPTAGGIVDYTSAGIFLCPSMQYEIVLTSATGSSVGSYNWSATTGFMQNSDWFINDAYYSSTDGQHWSETFRQDIFQTAIFATPAPEPSAWAIGGVGVAFLFWQKRWRINKA